MIGLGTIINVSLIIIGGLLGLLFGGRLNRRFQETLLKSQGLCLLFVGMGGAMEKMLQISGENLSSSGTIMIVVCFAVGSLIGEACNFEKRIEQFGEWIRAKTGNANDSEFVNAFVMTSLTVCIGAMAVVGSIQDGISGDYHTLALKGVIDMIIVCAKGSIFSAIPVALFQGTITILASFLQPIMTEQALANLSLTGSMLIFCVGVNMVWGKKFKPANMLPTIVIAVIWALIAA